MRYELPAQAVCVTIGIFASAGALAGMIFGGVHISLIGFFLGVTLGSLAEAGIIVRLGYLAATLVVLYAGQSLYAAVLMPGCRAAQLQRIEHDVPPGSSVERVEHILKVRHIDHVVRYRHADRGIEPAGNHPDEVVASYNGRCLLSKFSFKTVFVFDKHGHLGSYRIDGAQ